MDISLVNINKSFQGKVVLRDINMSLPKGKISCIMGPSGSGKTTLVNILMGLIKQDSGELIGTQGLRIAAVFQEDRLIEHWTAIKNVLLVCKDKTTECIVEEHFTEVSLKDYELKSVKKLSGGMRRRVAIVRALLAESELIILDEPFKGLDIDLKRQVIHYIKVQAIGKTVLVITHDPEDADLLQAETHYLPGAGKSNE